MFNNKDWETKVSAVLPHLNERQRRIWLAAEARMLGRGGISRVAKISGVSRVTLHKGMSELQSGAPASRRVRKPGGGRWSLVQHDRGLLQKVEDLVAATTRGDPMSPLRWTCKSTRQLAEALDRRGVTISHVTVAELLHVLGYSLQANVKSLEGADHPDRDQQFQYINR